MKKLFFGVLFIFLTSLAPRGFCADPQPAADEAPLKMGVEGGYFSCELPGDWKMETTDKPAWKVSHLTLLGPRAESSVVMISIFYFGDDNGYGDTREDFIERNTWDPWEEKAVATAQKIDLHGISASVFEKEFESSTDVESPYAARVLMKDKHYVFPSRDGKGFFVLHYTAPKSVYGQHLPIFEKIANTFTIL